MENCGLSRTIFRNFWSEILHQINTGEVPTKNVRPVLKEDE